MKGQKQIGRIELGSRSTDLRTDREPGGFTFYCAAVTGRHSCAKRWASFVCSGDSAG